MCGIEHTSWLYDMLTPIWDRIETCCKPATGHHAEWRCCYSFVAAPRRAHSATFREALIKSHVRDQSAFVPCVCSGTMRRLHRSEYGYLSAQKPSGLNHGQQCTAPSAGGQL